MFGDGACEMSRGQLVKGLGCQAQFLVFVTRICFTYNES